MPSPEVFLPGPFVTTPSSGPAVGNRPGCIPPLQVARFEQEVLHERGLAQVGFGALSVFSFYTLLSVRLTVSYSRLTKFEPLRLTHPTGLHTVTVAVERLPALCAGLVA